MKNLLLILTITASTLTFAMQETQQKWYTLYIKLVNANAEQQISEEVIQKYKDSLYYQKPNIQASNGLIPAGIMRLTIYDTQENIIQKFQGQSWFKPDLIRNMRNLCFLVPCDNADTEKKLKEEIKQEYPDMHYYDLPSFLSPSQSHPELYVEVRDTAEDLLKKFQGKPWFKPEMIKTSGVTLAGE